MGSIFFEITIIVCVAAVLAIIFRAFRQPAILAYVLTGIIIGPFGQLQLKNQDDLHTLAQFGITLLLFILGLELKFKDLKSIGKSALVIGLGQIVFTFLAGFFISSGMGFSQIISLYIATALTFSSTIIVVKLLSDRKDLASLYGKIVTGVLLIQDFFAILVLIILSAFNTSSAALSVETFALVFLKGFLLIVFVAFLSKFILPKIIHSFSRSSEILFLFSLAWVFGLSAIVSSQLIGFSIEIGGFLAGLALANSSENFQIAARVKTLRDFFITLFFVVLGMEMTFTNLNAILIPGILFSLFVIFIKPLIVISVSGALGYRKRTSFLSGVNLAQISEFSLIIVFLGNKIGHVPSEIVSLIAMIGIITFLTSTYTILGSNSLYKFTKNYLFFFERKESAENKNIDQEKKLEELKNHAILIGAHRMGESILAALEEEEDEVVVVDFDPDVVERLKEKGILSVFGDISDLDIQERVQLHKAKLVISTVPDMEDNTILIKSLNHVKDPSKRKTKVVLLAQNSEDAKELYEKGADYVIFPHLVGGMHLAKLVKDENLEKIEQFKARDMKYLV